MTPKSNALCDYRYLNTFRGRQKKPEIRGPRMNSHHCLESVISGRLYLDNCGLLLDLRPSFYIGYHKSGLWNYQNLPFIHEQVNCQILHVQPRLTCPEIDSFLISRRKHYAVDLIRSAFVKQQFQ